MPFLRVATVHAHVTLLAKPHAAPLLARFAPGVDHLPLVAPWTKFRGKYRLHHWPWAELRRAIRLLREARFDCGVSARPDPRDHLLLALGGAQRRIGFARAGSRALLTQSLPRPERPHRAEHWQALAGALGWPIPNPSAPRRTGRRIAIHPGAAQAVREWPAERYEEIARRLRAGGWQVDLLNPAEQNLNTLLDSLATADRFIGNDSGPGHLAALLGVPTFTIFGPQLPEVFSPLHPHAGWIEGAPCPYKPCSDYCRFAEPHCILRLQIDHVWPEILKWLATD